MRTLVKQILPTVFRNRLRGFLPAIFFRRVSYSQCGEDLIINFVLNLICGRGPKRYLDVGANHPFHLSNTALLYRAGGHGVLVEPDPYFAKLLMRRRPRDTVLQVGVHFSGQTEADFFILDTPTLNTFARVEMERYVGMGHKLLKSISVELVNINSLLDSAGELDFLNLDIEGLDKTIIDMIDWQMHRPACVCVETVSYETNKEPNKSYDIIKFMQSVGYFHFADTYINSIFVDRSRWRASWNK
ncbi:MAG: FkbM family methyltransferase [Thermodesulfobacteriota bacterium]